MTHAPLLRSSVRLVTSLSIALALFLLSARGASAAGGFVYALNQVDGGPNQIYGFRVNPDVGVLTLLPGFPVASGGLGGPGSFSEHVAFRNGLLFVVNEGSASLSVLSVNPTTGALTAAPFSPITLGGDLACVAADPTAAPVVVGANLGGLWSLAITATTATIAPGSPFATPGERPFSCGFSQDGNYVYTGGSGGAGVSGFTVAPDTGVLTPLAGSPFEAGAGNPVGYATDSAGRLFMSNYNSSAVRVFTTSGGILTAAAGNPFPSGLSGGVQGILHPSGFYMVADRLAQQVGVFRIAGSGSSTTLTAVSGSPFGATGGVFTDALTLTAGGAFLVAANGITRNLTIFQVDTATGSLTSLGGQPSNSIGSTGFITGLTFVASGSRSVIGDFDGDAKSDFTVYRPSAGLWAILKSNRNYTTSQSLGWGLSSDVPVPGDYDGDGEIDPAIYRPSTGLWAILKSSTNYTTSMTVTWGISTDVPQAADYDGDGKADPAFYRPSSGAWAYLRSSANYTTSGVVSWGLSSDVPLVGDYDGDGKADPAIFRPSTGLWAFLRSSTNYFASTTVSWGLSTDIPVPGDYDGDGKTDPAIFRPATGVWAILKSSTNYAASATVSWGLSSDAPAPADYDGDGKFDPAVFRASTGNWYVLRSSTNFGSSFGVPWGLSTDTPINKRP